ncbi:hypothetical protein LNO89_30795 [Klebsiella pneumoniae subsp. pneumoniae]|nr:hypothetical protein [Klebsiella pneumoniae subsp. pneumoniae]
MAILLILIAGKCCRQQKSLRKTTYTLEGPDLQRASPPPPRGRKKRKNKKKKKKNMPKMCTVATHAERGAPRQRLCRAVRHVVLRFECDGPIPPAFIELSRRVDRYKVHTSTAAPAGDDE